MVDQFGRAYGWSRRDTLRLPYRDALELLGLIREHDDNERRFQASLHDRQLQERDGRIHGSRQQLMEKMRARQRGTHRR